MGVNSIRGDESSSLFPTRCLLSLVTNGNLILLVFYMGVNSNRADKLLAIVSTILNKKAFISGVFMSLQ